jgi:hypothetical protein
MPALVDDHRDKLTTSPAMLIDSDSMRPGRIHSLLSRVSQALVKGLRQVAQRGQTSASERFSQVQTP